LNFGAQDVAKEGLEQKIKRGGKWAMRGRSWVREARIKLSVVARIWGSSLGFMGILLGKLIFFLTKKV
jgi:hypothetical protein